MRIDVDVKRCIGAGQCVLTAPDVFDQNDNGFVEVLDVEQPSEPPESVERLRMATVICPSQSITLHES
ncbi:MAG: ferredoxin [Umezawaea sp.]